MNQRQVNDAVNRHTRWVADGMREGEPGYVDFSGQDLSERLVSNPDRARLCRTKFDKANMRKFCAPGVDFSGSSFKNADLRDALFVGARFPNCDFTDADLRGTNLSYADITGSVFDGAVTEGCLFGMAVHLPTNDGADTLAAYAAGGEEKGDDAT